MSADQLREYSAAAITGADTKATALLAIQGAVLALTQGLISSLDTTQQILHLAFLAAVTASAGAAAAVLWPRLASPSTSSAIFFMDVSRMSKDAYLTRSREPMDPDDLKLQAYQNAVIAAIKMRFIRVSVLATFAAVSLLAVVQSVPILKMLF